MVFCTFYTQRAVSQVETAYIACSLDILLVAYIQILCCDFQPSGIMTSLDSDEHAQPPFRLTHSK